MLDVGTNNQKLLEDNLYLQRLHEEFPRHRPGLIDDGTNRRWTRPSRRTQIPINPESGKFQCYDKYLKQDSEAVLSKAAHQEWNLRDDAGTYNNTPQKMGFLATKGTYSTEKGKFFFKWYSGKLMEHGDQILDESNRIFEGCRGRIAAKGYFQILYSCIEKLLAFLNIKSLVLPAIDDAKSIWTDKFVFKKIPQEQFSNYRKICSQMMTFKGTSMSEKPVPKTLALYHDEADTDAPCSD